MFLILESSGSYLINLKAASIAIIIIGSIISGISIIGIIGACCESKALIVLVSFINPFLLIYFYLPSLLLLSTVL